MIDGYVRLEGLSKGFREGGRMRMVLREASARFTRGEFVAILGKSGSGWPPAPWSTTRCW